MLVTAILTCLKVKRKQLSFVQIATLAIPTVDVVPRLAYLGLDSLELQPTELLIFTLRQVVAIPCNEEVPMPSAIACTSEIQAAVRSLTETLSLPTTLSITVTKIMGLVPAPS